MALKHLNLAVPDVATTQAFFETYFGFRCLELKGDNIIAILKSVFCGCGCFSIYKNCGWSSRKCLISCIWNKRGEEVGCARFIIFRAAKHWRSHKEFWVNKSGLISFEKVGCSILFLAKDIGVNERLDGWFKIIWNPEAFKVFKEAIIITRKM